MEYKPFPTYLNNPRTVTTEYAVTHPDELLKAVNQNNDAIFIRNDNDLAVLVPYWWYMNNFGSNVQRIVERLFKECRTKDIVTAKINLDIAHGYLSHVNQITGQEIQRSLMAKMDGHPYAQQWMDLLDRWSKSWQENHAKELWLVMAKYASDRKIYLLYQNGTTRVLDGRSLIGKGLKEADLRCDSTFYDQITMTSGALLWTSETGRIQRIASAEDLLELSTPVDPLQARSVWDTPQIRR